MKRWILGALLVGACSHTETVKQPDRPAQEAPKVPSKGAVSKANVEEGGAPVPGSPEGALAPGQLESIQGKLVDRGLLESKSGSMDEATRAALKKFQKSQDLPETGLPDQTTVAKLGLNPDGVFAKNPRTAQ